MSLLTRIAKAIINEVKKPKSFVMGEEFEQFLQDEIFPDDQYYMEHRSHDYNANKGDYVFETLDPDFVFVSVKGEKMFFVEAKFRSKFYKGAVEWCKPHQLKRYKEANQDLPVFIALGVGGIPTSPDHLYIFPVKHIKYNKLFQSVLKEYELDPSRSVGVKTLWEWL